LWIWVIRKAFRKKPPAGAKKVHFKEHPKRFLPEQQLVNLQTGLDH
jgi:hypothetical protein